MIFRALLKALDQKTSAVLVTVVSTSGSTPREAGARLVVRADGAISGTIGGGTLEWQMIAEAQALTSRKVNVTLIRREIVLGPDLGQCCGGRVTTMLELFVPADRDEIAPLATAEALGSFETIGTPSKSGRYHRRLVSGNEERNAVQSPKIAIGERGEMIERWGEEKLDLLLFGAGHVAKALILALAPLPFDVLWFDARPEAFPSHVPPNVKCFGVDGLEALESARNDSMVLAMTHSHALDLAIVDAALRQPQYGLVGVIGSRTKRARFASQLRQSGLDEAAIRRMVCPIGVGEIDGKEPAILAASVAAQLLVVRSKALARRRNESLAHRISGTVQ